MPSNQRVSDATQERIDDILRHYQSASITRREAREELQRQQAYDRELQRQAAEAQEAHQRRGISESSLSAYSRRMYRDIMAESPLQSWLNRETSASQLEVLLASSSGELRELTMRYRKRLPKNIVITTPKVTKQRYYIECLSKYPTKYNVVLAARVDNQHDLPCYYVKETKEEPIITYKWNQLSLITGNIS